MADFKLTPAREKELEKIAKDLPDAEFKKRYGKDWKSIKIATAMNILKKKYGFKEETKMKFKDLREKMSGSKLTGQEISVWYRKNKDVAKAVRKDKNLKKAVEIALDHGGAMNYAIKKIEKIKRGLADNPHVAKALSFANFGEDKDLTEGTWDVPSDRRELAILVDMLMKPYPATKPSDIDKFLQFFPVGDDSLYDALDSVMYEKESDGSIKRPLKKMNSFKKVFLNVIAGEALMADKWIRGKTMGNKFKVTHHSFGKMETVDQQEGEDKHLKKHAKAFSKGPKGRFSQKKTMNFRDEELPSRPKAKRKSGNNQKKPMQKVEMTESVKKADPLDRAERILNYKLKELQYKSELRRFNEFEEDKVKQYRMEANNQPLAKRAEKRFKGIDKRMAQRIANAVKPGRVIQSKLYVELGDLWDKGDKKGFEKHLKKHEAK